MPCRSMAVEHQVLDVGAFSALYRIRENDKCLTVILLNVDLTTTRDRRTFDVIMLR